MGYFSNGSEGLDYECHYCLNCVHYGDDEEGPGCPVWLAHLLFSYEECNSDSNAKQMLDLLIPIKDGNNQQCTMFVGKDGASPGQQRIEFEIGPWAGAERGNHGGTDTSSASGRAAVPRSARAEGAA